MTPGTPTPTLDETRASWPTNPARRHQRCSIDGLTPMALSPRPRGRDRPPWQPRPSQCGSNRRCGAQEQTDSPPPKPENATPSVASPAGPPAMVNPVRPAIGTLHTPASCTPDHADLWSVIDLETPHQSEKSAIAIAPHGCWLQTEHAGKSEGARADSATAHPRRDKLVSPRGPGLNVRKATPSAPPVASLQVCCMADLAAPDHRFSREPPPRMGPERPERPERTKRA